MNNLKIMRNQKKLKQSDVADRLSISSQAYSNYENELRDIPTKILIDLSNIFNCSIDYLLCQDTNFSTLYTDDPEYAAMVNLWNKMDHGKKMMTLGYMERLNEEPY